MKIICIATCKGGAGKTTTAATLAQAAAASGKKTLAIDINPQGQLSFLLKADTSKPGSYELLNGEGANRCIQPTEGALDVVPASWALSTITSFRGSARRLQKAIEPVKNEYDYIFIDCPTDGELLYNALQASTDIIIPVGADVFGLQSIYQIVDIIKPIRKSNPALKMSGYVVTRYRGNANLTKQIRATMKEKAEALDLPELGAVREAIAVQEAAGFQESLFNYAPKSKPAQDYMNIFKTIDKMED